MDILWAILVHKLIQFSEKILLAVKKINDKWQAEIDDIRIITQNRTDAKV